MKESFQGVLFFHRSIVGLAIDFLVGLCIGMAFTPKWFLVLAALPLAFAAQYAFNRLSRQKWKYRAGIAACAHASVVIAAIALASCAQAEREKIYAPLHELLEARESITIGGTVVTEPRGRVLKHGGGRLRFDIRAKALINDFGVTELPPFRLTVDCYGHRSIAGPNPSRPMPRGGEGWEFTGKLRESRWKNGKANIILSVEPRELWSNPEYDEPPLIELIWDIRRAAAETLAEGIRDDKMSISVLRTMLLGYRDELPDDSRKLFSDSGVMHILAISGLHIGIIAEAIIFMLPLFGVQKRRFFFLLCPILFFYAYLTGWRPSAQRACMMYSIAMLGPLIYHRPDPLAALCATLVVMLAASPLWIYDLGFVFSFVCVASILIMARPYESLFGTMLTNEGGGLTVKDADIEDDLMRRIKQAEARAIERERRKTFTGRLAYGIASLLKTLPGSAWRKVKGIIIISTIAWFASAPLTATFFGKLSPVGIINNIVAIPAATVIVICGCISLVGGIFFVSISVVANTIASCAIKVLVSFISFTARIPHSVIQVESWGLGMTIAWYAALLAITFFAHLAVARSRDESIVIAED